jgi:thymidylate kinase
LEFLLGSWFRLRPVVFKGGLVLIDRWYYDFFVDQKRYRLRVPPVLIRFGYVFLKKPDLVLLLDAPAEILQQRKQEVSILESQKQREAYLALTSRLPQARVIDAAQPVATVADNAIKAVLEFMVRRQEKRLPAPSRGADRGVNNSAEKRNNQP